VDKQVTDENNEN